MYLWGIYRKNCRSTQSLRPRWLIQSFINVYLFLFSVYMYFSCIYVCVSCLQIYRRALNTMEQQLQIVVNHYVMLSLELFL